MVDGRVSDTYAKDSKATLVNKLNDPYVKAIRWASDRIGQDGVVAFVSNSSFIHKNQFDGMRKHLENDFNRIYIVDLKGDVRSDSMRGGIPIGEHHTIFGLAAMVGISISFLIRRNELSDHKIFYSEVDWRASRKEKFEYLERGKDVYGLEREKSRQTPSILGSQKVSKVSSVALHLWAPRKRNPLDQWRFRRYLSLTL